MTSSTWRIQFTSRSTVVFLQILFLSSIVLIENVTAQIEAQPWYEAMPAVAMDYKVHLPAGKEDCYYQYVQQGATLYVRFQVINGGDGKAGLAIKHPNGQLVKPYEWLPSSEYSEPSATGGYYGICLDNQFSRFASKLVNIYITVIKYDQWTKYAQEIEGLKLNMQNFTQAIGMVDRNINAMQQFQSLARSTEARDFALLVDNNSYVQNWSLIQIIVIALTCSIQVYFVRKLFDVNSGGYGRARI